jgi:hypothetical protein
LVLHQGVGDDAPGRLHRRATEATAALGAAGVTLAVLDGQAAAQCLSRALDPASGPRAACLAASDQPVTTARPWSAGEGGYA